MNRTALVTGATGFLGTHLCAALARRGDRVVALVRDVSAESQFWAAKERMGAHVVLVRGEVEDLACLRRAMAEYGVELVFHLAAQTEVGLAAKHPMDTYMTNTLGTASVLEACRVQTKPPRVIVASTDKVYGNSPVPYREDSPLSERTPYGASKLCAEIIAQTYANAHGISVASTRCGNLYGPGHVNWSTLIPGTIRRVFYGQRPVVRFGGKATRDFLHVEDAVRAYLTLADKDAVGPYNFSGGEPTPIIDIVRMILERMDADVEPEVTEGGAGEIAHQALCCDKARTELAWSPLVSLADGLSRTVAWYTDYLSRG